MCHSESAADRAGAPSLPFRQVGAPSSLFRHLSERARYEPALLGARLEAIKVRRGWGDAELAAALCGTEDGLAVARVCYPPRDRAGCELIAARCGFSAGALARLLDIPERAGDENAPTS